MEGIMLKYSIFSVSILSIFLGVGEATSNVEVTQYRNIGIDSNEWDAIKKEEYSLDKAVGVLKCGIMCSDSKRSDCGGTIYHKNKGISFLFDIILHYNHILL